MFFRRRAGTTLWAALVAVCTPAYADWGFSGSPTPNAFIHTGNLTLELQCDRMRFTPAGYADALDIERKQGLSIRFIKNGSTDAGAFQAGVDNADIRIVDNYPVEVVFLEKADYDFVLDQIARSLQLNVATIDGEVSYGVFDLKGSGAAIRSLRTACGARRASGPAQVEALEGTVYCGGGAVRRRIQFSILENPKDKWNARVTVNGETIRAMTAYSYFGKSRPPRGFVVALLGEDRSEFLVFTEGGEDWLEFGDYRYSKCD